MRLELTALCECSCTTRIITLIGTFAYQIETEEKTHRLVLKSIDTNLS